MGLPTSEIVHFAENANQIFAGTTSDVYVVEGSLAPTTPSLFAIHGLSLQGKPNTSAGQSARFTGGLVGASATCTVQPVLTRGVNLGTINQVEIALPTPAGGPAEIITVQYDTQSADTATTIATGLEVALQNVFDNVALAAGSRVFSTNPLNGPADFSSAFQDVFLSPSTAAFSVAGSILTLTAKVGVNGNNLILGTSVLNSMPSPIITVDGTGQPQTDRLLIHLGAQDAFQAVATPITLDVNASNQLERFARITTGETLEVNFKLFQDNNLKFASVGINRSALSFNNTTSLLTFGGLSLPAKFGIVFTSVSRIVGGAYDVIVFYECQASALTIDRAKGTLTGYQVKFAPNALKRQGDPVGYYAQVRV